jgi:type II secretory pathway component PulJ
MLLSIGIIAILLTATVSTLFVAQRAVASGADSADRTSQESWAMQMITMDVSLATAFTEHTDRAITMTVPDRTGDGQPETIRYAWSGTPGDPLTRQVNGGTAVVLANNVYQLRLTYLTRTTP